MDREIKFRQYLGNGQWHYWGFLERIFVSPLCSLNSAVILFEMLGKEQFGNFLCDYNNKMIERRHRRKTHNIIFNVYDEFNKIKKIYG